MTPAVLDHLWQSTLLALAVVVLTMAFRRASASVRHGLWLAASVKFLIPFTVLAMLGRVLAPSIPSPVPAREAALIAQAARPLAQFPFSRASSLRIPLAPEPPAALSANPLMPHVGPVLILLAIWALGCGAILISWMVRSAGVRATVRSAVPLPWPAPMPVLASPSLMEPGLIGLWRPVLVVPQTLPDHLSQPEIDAILAHEAAHLRRRDNLTAALHMLVEALFWFHPLVWWIGGRLIAEREQACDEAVVRSGHDRTAYARSLVQSCRLYLQSPLDCVAGASGSDLRTRVESIMTAPPALPLSLSRKALLLTAGVCAIATPVAVGLLTSPAGQKAVARATAVAASFAPVPASDVRPTGPAAETTLVAQKPALAPALAVATVETAPAPPAQDIAAPIVETAPPPAAAAPQAVQPAIQPVAAIAAPPPSPSARMTRADAEQQALSFLQTSFQATARWGDPLCIQVVGLSADQEAAVRRRVAEVAGAVGPPTQPAGCKRTNVEIGFTTDPQSMLDGLAAKKAWLLGDRTSGTRSVKAVSQPIQAWYLTNGVQVSAADARGLKVDVVFQSQATPCNCDLSGAHISPQTQYGVGADGHYLSETYGNSNAGVPSQNFQWNRSNPALSGQIRQFQNVFVIVDLRRTGDKSLGLIADYVAMLALSQPRSLDHCNALPSVTDLFAGRCPGRGAPDGMTPADAAYLTALYAADGSNSRSGQEADIARRMARILAPDRMASR